MCRGFQVRLFSAASPRLQEDIWTYDWQLCTSPNFLISNDQPAIRLNCSFCRRVIAFEIDPRAECLRPAILFIVKAAPPWGSDF
jgi:hypothetical protein